MTREEAIKELSYIADDMPSMECANWIEAISMGINALEQEPCGDAISRQAVLKAIDAKAWEFCDYLISKGKNDEQKPVSHFADNLRECISEDLPSVTPTEKVGHWIEDVDRWGDIVTTVNGYRCSRCNAFNTDKDNYCPNCGAKMQEREE